MPFSSKTSASKRRGRSPADTAAPRGLADAELITDLSLFSQDEPTFTNYGRRRRVKVYLVRAPWSRVVLLSLIYAFAITFAKFGYFYVFGKPQLVASDAKPAADH